MSFGLRPEKAAAEIGSKQLLDECVAAGWIKPVVQRHKLTLYDYTALAKCWARIAGGELPAPLSRKRKGARS